MVLGLHDIPLTLYLPNLKTVTLTDWSSLRCTPFHNRAIIVESSVYAVPLLFKSLDKGKCSLFCCISAVPILVANLTSEAQAGEPAHRQ